MNLLLLVISVFSVNFAAAEASKSITPVKRRPDDEEQVGCFGLCTAFIVGAGAWLASGSAGAIVATGAIGGALGGAAVFGLEKGYDWYTKSPGYELLDYGEVCKSGMEITTWKECQKALAASTTPSAKGLVQNLKHEDDKATMPKGCFVESHKTWNQDNVIEAAFNADGSPSPEAMEKIKGNALCKTYQTQEELEAQVAEFEKRAAESAVATSAISEGQHDILNKILFMFIGASLGGAAMYCMRKDGGSLRTNYEAI